jgi:hypothetical protein
VWGAPLNVTVPLGLGTGVTAGSPVAISSYADLNATLVRTGMFGNFVVYEDPANTTTYPTAGWETGLEAWVGLWSDGGDSTLTVPTDPFDQPNPSPGWLVTSFMEWKTELTQTPRRTLSTRASLPSSGLWSHAQRKTRSNPVGTFQTVYFCWTMDSQFLPLPGSSSGSVDYKVGMDFWFRTLYEIP